MSSAAATAAVKTPKRMAGGSWSPRLRKEPRFSVRTSSRWPRRNACGVRGMCERAYSFVA
jgi:hypothetical protein